MLLNGSKTQIYKADQCTQKIILKINFCSKTKKYYQTIYSFDIFYITRTHSIRVGFELKVDDIGR